MTKRNGNGASQPDVQGILAELTLRLAAITPETLADLTGLDEKGPNEHTVGTMPEGLWWQYTLMADVIAEHAALSEEMNQFLRGALASGSGRPIARLHAAFTGENGDRLLAFEARHENGQVCWIEGSGEEDDLPPGFRAFRAGDDSLGEQLANAFRHSERH